MLFFIILVCMLLGWLIMTTGPLMGGIITFGIVVGCLFRGLFLISEIHKQIVKGEKGADSDIDMGKGELSYCRLSPIDK
ncbi:hypothetical protein LC065_05225 [Halobacillus litoralis]|uniref:hypothetical protein n=1 Tax=Halobacillus litoralis TaxID=45668 RepID=UPI001CFCDEE9|nr:hypothetical protein [Halobacillus litoralis]WLR48593.1 hypothetical protein LC065_05225 [Halobacillus litoralis]